MDANDPSYTKIPHPNSDYLGKKAVAQPGIADKKAANAWAPKGAGDVPLSTVARFAQRLMKADGTAISAEEIGGGGNLLESDNSWEGVQSYGNTLTTNGLFLAGPLASFSYLGSTAAAHRTALGAETPAGAAAQIAARENRTRYPKRRVAFLGDSITGWWSNLGLGAAANSMEGFGAIAQALTGYGFEIVPSSNGFNFQTGGFTLTQIQTTWLPEVIASDADVCFLLGGTNGGAGDTAAAKFEKWVEIINALDAANILPITATVPPVGDNTSESIRNIYREFNNMIRAHCIDNNILLCDWHDMLTDPATNLLSLDYSGDKVHPNYTGGFLLAKALAQVLAPITTPLNRIPSVADVRWLSSNPYMTGNVSGLPTGWSRTLVGTGTATSTKVARNDDKLGEMLQVVVAGGGGRTDGVVIVAPAATTGYAANELVKATLEVEFDASGWDAWTLGTHLTIVGGTNHAYRAYHPYLGSTNSINALTKKMIVPVSASGRTIIFETPPHSTGVGATSILAEFHFRGAGTFRILRGGVVKA